MVLQAISEIVCAVMGHDFTVLSKSEKDGTQWRCVRCGLEETRAERPDSGGSRGSTYGGGLGGA